jgi:hypothetical protein
VELAAGLEGNDPECVVSIVACTGDWTGGWDNTLPAGVDRFITADGAAGRMVEVIERGEPAMMLAHWTGIYFNGQELGLQIMQEVVKRLHARYDNLIWMKLAELARYWAAKELTSVALDGEKLRLKAPFACPSFTLRARRATGIPAFQSPASAPPLEEHKNLRQLKPGTWHREGDAITMCIDLPKGESTLTFS